MMLTVFSFNERGFRAYRRAGFREIGRRRKAHRFGGRACDVISMDCMSTDRVPESGPATITPTRLIPAR